MTTNTEALAALLQSAVKTYPQMSEDEPGGYCTAEDQLMDEAAAELRRLSAMCAEWEAKAATWLASAEAAQRLAGYRELGRECAELEAERDALKADAERLNWLESQREAYGFQDIHEGNRWSVEGPFANVRAAIDAAMKDHP